MVYTTYIFGLNDTLYNATEQKSRARFAAVEAMIENGLPVDIETAYTTLEEVVREAGEDAPNHFNILLKRLGVRDDPRIIAAGVVAYRDVSRAALRPFPSVPSTLITLRERGRRLVALSCGDAVKEWQKLIQLGLQHYFHTVWVCEGGPLTAEAIKSALTNLAAPPTTTLFVSGVPSEVDAAGRVGLKAALFQPRTVIPPKDTLGAKLIVHRFQEILGLDP
ncbi:MAG: HAD family hydrolase [Thermoprotei archaeon]